MQNSLHPSFGHLFIEEQFITPGHVRHLIFRHVQKACPDQVIAVDPTLLNHFQNTVSGGARTLVIAHCFLRCHHVNHCTGRYRYGNHYLGPCQGRSRCFLIILHILRILRSCVATDLQPELRTCKTAPFPAPLPRCRRSALPQSFPEQDWCTFESSYWPLRIEHVNHCTGGRHYGNHFYLDHTDLMVQELVNHRAAHLSRHVAHGARQHRIEITCGVGHGIGRTCTSLTISLNHVMGEFIHRLVGGLAVLVLTPDLGHDGHSVLLCSNR